MPFIATVVFTVFVGAVTFIAVPFDAAVVIDIVILEYVAAVVFKYDTVVAFTDDAMVATVVLTAFVFDVTLSMSNKLNTPPIIFLPISKNVLRYILC